MPTLSDNKEQFVINADSIFLNNRDDRHNSHIVFHTSGIVNENDIEFSSCNVKVLDGDFSTKRINDLSGNAVMEFNSGTIDFKNSTINNLNFSTGSVTANTVASANGYASLDLELDAHLSLINGKVSQNGHTANKIFVSSNGGAFTTTGNCLVSDLSKLATNSNVDTNTTNIATNTSDITSIKTKTDHISVTQSVDLDTMESGISSNTSAIQSNDTDISNIKSKTDFISVTQAVNLDTIESSVTSNTSNISTNTTNITNIKSKTDNISVTQAVNLDTIESGVSTNASNIATNTSNINSNDTDITNMKLKTDNITVTQAVNLDTMESSVSTNTSSILSNTSNISNNTSNITTNTSNISSNTSSIAGNTSNISTNTSNISTNTSNITTNTSNISSNSSNITSNTSNISTNTTNVASAKSKTDYIIVNQAVNLDTMESDIGTNTSNIATNSSNISANTSDITAVNAGRVANANAIAINAGNISTNTSNISTNSTNISNNTQTISNQNGQLNSINSDIADIEEKTNKINVTNSVNLNTETHGNVTLFAGNVGAISYVNNKCGDLTLKGGYDGTYDSGDIKFFTDNTERLSIDKNGKMIVGTSPLHIFKSGGQEPLSLFESGSDCSIRVEGPGGEVYVEIANTNTSDGSTSNSWGIGTNDDIDLHFAYGANGTMNKTDKMVILNDGRVGIGTNSPLAGLQVNKTYSTNGNTAVDDDSVTYWNYFGTSGATFDFNSNNYQVSIIGKGLIYAELYVGASDERIKKNIVEVDDDRALEKLRDISCCWYEYIDKIQRSSGKTIGFIAQQVKKFLPEAVQEVTDFIPSVMKQIEVSWNETKMSSPDLQDVSGVKYKFFVSNDMKNEQMVELVGDKNDCFTFAEKWKYVFCYGKEVNDFHTLDKQKLFALNFSATQELDKKVSWLEEENKLLKMRLDALEAN